MKRLLIPLLILALTQAACSLPSLAQATATSTATEIVLPSDTPTPAATDTPTGTPLPSDTPTITPTASDTPEPSDTPTATATATEPPFDPAASYGAPTLYDPMDNDKNWSGSNGLPDDDNIRLALGGGQLHVTGKLAGWDTWWFTASAPSDFFLEMTVDSGNCSGQQAYGFIVRGPKTAGDEAKGYIYTFACDGTYRLDRLDDTAPYTKVELVGWTNSDFINDGANETNVIGVRMVGDTINLYANGFAIDEVEDGKFDAGRFGLFVNAGPSPNYTFDIDELSYWNLH